MPPSDFARANIDIIVEKLTTDEAIHLIGGSGHWSTSAVERLGIPSIKVSDGPNGVRGNHFFMGTPAKTLPASTALGATFDPDLVEVVGLKLLASEAKLRAASVLLAPTCNIQRNPLGGRSFECFSEDPYLSGMIAAAYVKGVQSGGIATVIKHFVGNDKEDDRKAYDSIISDRALREIYLMPFMLAEKYNRVNGTHVSENPDILQKILRDEWKFEGLIMSDWFGTYGIENAINAGLDLEMPGTKKWRTIDLVNRAIESKKVSTRIIKARARNVLEFVQKCCQEAPEILDGDGEERTVESDDDKVLMKQIASESIVLLKNEGKLLPLKPQGIKKIAVVGGNAKQPVLSGGGSAALKPSYFISPYQGIVNALGSDVEVAFSEGAPTYQHMPTLEYELLTEDGRPGWMGSWYPHTSDNSMSPLDKPVLTQYVDETKSFICTSYPKGLTYRWTLKLKGYLKPREINTDFGFGLASSGRARLYVDGNLVVDNWTRQRRGDLFFGSGSQEDHGVYTLKAGVKHEILLEYCNVRAPADGDEDEPVMDADPAFRLGGAPVTNPDALMEEAVKLAKEADAVIAVVGLNAEWETESNDRTTLALPGRTDELVEKVVAANPKTIVVTQAGSAIAMPWVDKVPTIVHAWYLGNATGDAIADVLFGKFNPSAKLSITFPKRIEDVPSHGHFHSENGKIRYAEDLYVGYKHYHHRSIDPMFAFGHGLSYTTFSVSDLKVSEPSVTANKFSLSASVTVTNTGSIAGSEVVQFYVALPTTAEVTHPLLQLKAFAKVKNLQPGKSETVEVKFDKYAVSYWDDRWNVWVVDKGEYGLKAGTSSVDLPLSAKFVLSKGFEWNGL
ncbi:hypothetical protein VNI00_009875 [Paramarasmius palmivorus]|uniref:beta-glucosidase n=1 Tax=Paramarasmius palmivorus TaxID=297713 RepID=A0AAW0CPG5_9AGAR